ncbi:S41 family peptidase [Chromobacterium piscinae]|uniref:S41 family peptidase n=1 Tax=Chromobacterium piscinae TaxID=686831 RepID=UPI001E4F3904|nr:S41 family peptidase [Chromobacterium piscinae]MCD5329566.1 S41 family peptidase [Chromobacterium piscinae]
MPPIFAIRLALILLLGALSFTPSTASAETGFNRQGWLEDYRLLKLELEKRYSHLAWMASPGSGADLPRLDRQAQAALTRARNDAEAKQAILDFQSGFRDGHFSLLNTAIETPASGAEPPARDLSHDNALDGCASLGYASRGAVSFSLPFESLPGVTLTADGLARPMRSGAADLGSGGTLALLRIPSFNPNNYPQLCQQAWNAMLARDGRVDTDKLFTDTMRAWYRETALRLRELRAAGARALIVDIGGNSGGNDSGDAMSRLLGNGPVRSAPLWLARSPQGEAYLREWIESLSAGLPPEATAADKAALQPFLDAFRAQASKLRQTPPVDMSWVWRERRAFDPGAARSRLVQIGYASGALDRLEPGRYSKIVSEALFWPALAFGSQGAWQGPVYLLTDGQTYSAAEMFAAVSRDNRLAKTVGQRTGGDGCGFMGKAQPLTLPHSGLRFRIPDCVRLRADGSDEVAGIAPDLPVSAAPGESKRALARKTLMAIAADLASHLE